jgi:hypothetical protein
MQGFSDESLGQMTDEEVLEYFTIVEVMSERQKEAVEGKKIG